MYQKDIIEKLKEGKIGVLATDTLYGVVGLALSAAVVERIFTVRHRDLFKPFIVLISSIQDLDLFEITLNEEAEKFLSENWPGPVSVILPCPSKKFEYLHRGTHSIAFRMPVKDDLRMLLRETGPLVAPSANLSGQLPATTIEEAKNYFKDTVDFYIDEGKVEGKASKIVSILGDEIKIIRE